VSRMATGFHNFFGQYSNRAKEADVTFLPRVGPHFEQTAEFPTVVLEAGWDESSTQLRRDAHLWQMGSGIGCSIQLRNKFKLRILLEYTTNFIAVVGGRL